MLWKEFCTGQMISKWREAQVLLIEVGTYP